MEQRGLRLLRSVVGIVVLSTLSASSAQTTIQLKEAKLKGIDGTKEILDWAPTSAKAGVAVLCDDDFERQCGPGITLLKPTGKAKPFVYLGHDDARAALAWPDGGYAARRPGERAQATGVVVLVSRNPEGLALYTGQVKKNGKLKGALKLQAILHPAPFNTGGNGGSPPLVRASMYDGRVGVVVVFKDGAFPYPTLVRFVELNDKGALIGKPVELSYSHADEGFTRPDDIVRDGSGWHVLANDDDGTFDRGRLLGWTVPVGSTRARVEAQTIAELPVPSGADATSYDGWFVRDFEPLTVFYEEVVRWKRDEARKRKVAPIQTTRYLTELGNGSRAARREVVVQGWDRVVDIWNTSATSTPHLVESTSTAIARGSDHVFAIGRTVHRNLDQQSSWHEPHQEFSIYRLDVATGEAELLSRLVRAHNRAGGISPVLARRFGNQTTILFNWNDSLAYLDRVLLTSF